MLGIARAAVEGQKKARSINYFWLTFWRRRWYSDFFSEFNKIKGLALYILVKIAKGHQKGHQKLNMKSLIDDWCEIAIAYLEMNQFDRVSSW